MKPIWMGGLVLALGFSGQQAMADTVTVDTRDLGWYRSDGHHDEFNENTFTGDLGLEYRSFYVWDLPTLTNPVTSARIDFDLQYSLGVWSTVPQTGRMFDVSTSSSTLTQTDGGGTGHAIFGDLGSGTSYGDFVISEADNLTLFSVQLNQAGLDAINSASGRPFSIGMSNVSPYQQSFLFSSISFRGSQQLVLSMGNVAPVPEPQTWALMALGLGVLGATARRQGRR